MKPTSEMYTTLFNGITDARKILAMVIDMIDNLQRKTEELYIEQEDDDE